MAEKKEKIVYFCKDEDDQFGQGNSIKDAYDTFVMDHGPVELGYLTFYECRVLEVELQIIEKLIPVEVSKS